MVENLNRQRVLSLLDEFYAGDVEAALARCSDDVDLTAPAPVDILPHMGRRQGKDAVRRTWMTVHARYSGMRYEVPIQLGDASNSPPTLTTLHPTLDRQDFTTHLITISGTAADPDGVSGVTFSLFSQTLGGYLHADGTIGTFAQFAAGLDHPGAALVAWSLPVTIPSGDWTLLATPRDTKGAVAPAGVRTTFVMAPGDPAPTATVSSPLPNVAIPANLTISGTAADDTAVRRVLVQVRDNRFGLGPQVGGGFGRAIYIPATVASPGARSTTWSLPVANLPPGVYTISAYGIDDLGLTTGLPARPAVLVRQGPTPPAVGPDTRITGPNAATFRAGSLTVPLTGTASYPGTVSSLWLVAKETRTGVYLQHDGTTGLTFDHVAASVASPGGTSTTWARSLVLPRAGTWLVEAIAVGADGSLDWDRFGGNATYLVYPGDADPTLEYNSPVSGTSVPDGRIAAAGRAFDDLGVASVQLQIVETGSPGVGLRLDGSIGAPQWIPAFVSNAGGSFTNWNYVSPPMPSGGWTVLVNPLDSVGKGLVTIPSRTVTVP